MIHVHWIDVGHVGKPYCNPKFVQLINGAHRFRVVASKPVSTLDDDVREFSSSRVIQQALIFGPVGRRTGQHIYILVENRHLRTVQYIRFNSEPLPCS
ncbi:MAG: hypothetical protein U0703_20850 [Anaerolineae bacterium]